MSWTKLKPLGNLVFQDSITLLPTPNVIQNEMVEPFDVDDTLVLHQDENTIPDGEKLLVQDPVHPGAHVIVRIHRPMVRLLEESHARGAHVIVWSRSGWQWAKNVVEALGLTNKVHTVMSKPVAYFDDSPIEKWLPYRVYLSPDTIYKQSTNNPKPTKKES